MNAIARFGLVALLTGCEIPLAPERIELQTDRTEYRMGDEILLTLTNLSSRKVVVPMPDPFCWIHLQRFVDGRWEHQGEREFCSTRGHGVSPGRWLTTGIPVVEEEFGAEGRYRFVGDSAVGDIPSNEFRVVGDS